MKPIEIVIIIFAVVIVLSVTISGIIGKIKNKKSGCPSCAGCPYRGGCGKCSSRAEKGIKPILTDKEA